MTNNLKCKVDKEIILHKSHLPNLIENMVNNIKIKCPNYKNCKWKGIISGLKEHESICNARLHRNKIVNNNSSNVMISMNSNECPLSMIGCSFVANNNIGQHLQDYQMQHWSIIVNFMDTQMMNVKDSYEQKVCTVQMYRIHILFYIVFGFYRFYSEMCTVSMFCFF